VVDLNDAIPADSGWLLRFAEAINDSGRIVGRGRAGGEERPFLLAPVDSVAPRVLVPPGVRAEASGPEGGLVSFAASAEDDVEGPVPVTCALPSGSVFSLGATIAFEVAGFDLVDRGVVATCDPPSGSVFPVGPSAVGCRATDASGNQVEGRFRVYVRGVDEQLADLLGYVGRRRLGPGKCLEKKLERAEAALARSQPHVACQVLSALVHEVGAQSSEKVSTREAAEFREAAERIRGALGCSR
jgi:hypothetical protein